MYEQPLALRSVLDPKFLEYCLSPLYDMGEWKQCLYWLRGLNDTYRVETSNGYFILRIYRAEVSERDVRYELSLLTALEKILDKSKTNISEPIPQNDSTLYTIINAPEGKRVAVIYRYLNGIESNLDDEDSCFSFGKSAAELHAAMDLVTVDHPRYDLDTDFLIKQSLNRIVEYIGEEHEAVSYLTQFATALENRIKTMTKSGLDWGLCHGDMHGNNNAFQEGELFTHYDFEWAARGWRAYDLAQVKVRKRLPTEKKEMLWNSFIAGYRSIIDFSVEDEKAIDVFIIARRFWVMGLDVAFIDNDTGALDYQEAWLNDFLEEFHNADIHLGLKGAIHKDY